MPAKTVEVMVAIHVHDPDLMLTDAPSGDRLRAIASEALNRHDPSQTLAPGARLVGVVAARPATGVTDGVLGELGLTKKKYSLEMWDEALSDQITVKWVAASRKRRFGRR